MLRRLILRLIMKVEEAKAYNSLPPVAPSVRPLATREGAFLRTRFASISEMYW